ncbi:redox-sensing transcriptional repressor [Singulisphaera sp. GP187]|uniref:redox-sensing transcriptional repressor Rex n=1 Tax=Singulisphaera sp. GP187 TaxID=1882752 RepID=UPI00092A0B81|nr:redox-sensing transcriptional repressor Rex [Singulisphaera sp. GP187]SIO34279.1 redox-sensing transcriptional repressor [Singulisphaera sp. GP187]
MRDPRRDPSGDKLAPKAVVGRVSLYLRQLETFQRQGQTTISSSQLGAALAIHNAQVRKDLAFFGQFGYPGIGYRIEELIPALQRILGIDRDLPLALVGLGNLGRALLRYRGFRSRGFHIVALFDNDPQKVGRTHDGLVVEPIEAMAKIVAARSVTLAVLSVPGEVAQRVADQLVSCGILGIMNFAPIPLNVPPSVSVVAIDLSIQLEHLAYKVQNTQGGISYVG